MMELGKKKILGHYFIMKNDSIIIVIPMYAQIPHSNAMLLALRSRTVGDPSNSRCHLSQICKLTEF